MEEKRIRKPSWLKVRLPSGEGYTKVNQIVRSNNLHTICSSGMCPNIGECWGNGTATFLILGDICTRQCQFCATITGKPAPPNPQEPERIAQSVKLMGLKYCVITSVTRDDLPDSGAKHWQNTINKVKSVNPTTRVEVLIPDFNGNLSDIKTALAPKPNVVAHNLETVERLTPSVRSNASFERSLKVIKHIASLGFQTKSGLMLGLGETKDEVTAAIERLHEAGCSLLTLGQYLQPRNSNLPVSDYVQPHEFDEYKKIALSKGFQNVESGPLVRSSYHAGEEQ